MTKMAKMTKRVGKWNSNEHQIFLAALHIHRNNWTKISDYIKTRNAIQIRTHAQKYFRKKGFSHKDIPIIPNIEISEKLSKAITENLIKSGYLIN